MTSTVAFERLLLSQPASTAVCCLHKRALPLQFFKLAVSSAHELRLMESASHAGADSITDHSSPFLELAAQSTGSKAHHSAFEVSRRSFWNNCISFFKNFKVQKLLRGRWRWPAIRLQFRSQAD